MGAANILSWYIMVYWPVTTRHCWAANLFTATWQRYTAHLHHTYLLYLFYDRIPVPQIYRGERCYFKGQSNEIFWTSKHAYLGHWPTDLNILTSVRISLSYFNFKSEKLTASGIIPRGDWLTGVSDPACGIIPRGDWLTGVSDPACEDLRKVAATTKIDTNLFIVFFFQFEYEPLFLNFFLINFEKVHVYFTIRN